MSGQKFALLSVYDKTGIVEFAEGLDELDYDIISTGGTYKEINEEYVPVTQVSVLTDFPEILNGRVKTLHPKIAGGMLYKRDNEEHVKTVSKYNIPSIDLVAVNLYPFEDTIKKKGITIDECIEQIDIGGPTMLRAAAKNFKDVIVACNPEQYELILKYLRDGEVPLEFRKELARQAFVHTAMYDITIANWHGKQFGNPDAVPEEILLAFEKTNLKMRYGTNWDQTLTGFFRRVGIDYGIPTIEQLTKDKKWERITEDKDFHGKALSFNNIFDVEVAVKSMERAVNELGEGIYSIVIKHGNDCGNSQPNTIEVAVELATSGDPISAFGGIRATYKILNKKAAEHIKGVFTEIVIAEDYTPEALEVLTGKKNIRILRHDFEDKSNDKFEYKTGKDLSYLMMENKTDALVRPELTKMLEDENYVLPEEYIGKLGMVAGDPNFYRDNKDLIHFGIVTCKNKFSNSITLVEEYDDGVYRQIGFGAGNTSRVLSVEQACDLARQNFRNEFDEDIKEMGEQGMANHMCVDIKRFEDIGGYDTIKTDYVKQSMKNLILVSDSFFPFADNIEVAQEYGIKNIVVNGGSNRDAEVIAKAKEFNMNMLFTGVRYFRH